MKGIISSDKLFAIPGVVVITIGGFAAVIDGGIPILKTGWIFWPLVLFILSGLIFSWKLAPLQRKIYQLIKKTDANKSGTLLFLFKAMGKMGIGSNADSFRSVDIDGDENTCLFYFLKGIKLFPNML